MTGSSPRSTSATRDLKIAIELDGSIHLEDDVRERDLPRQNDLVLLGWTVLRFTWKRFTERPTSSSQRSGPLSAPPDALAA